MADRPGQTRPAPRRKVTGQMSIAHSPSSSVSAATVSAAPSAAPRLKARVNPASIASASATATPPPRPRKTPSNLSLSSDNTPTTARTGARSPVASSSSRSSVGAPSRAPVSKALSRTTPSSALRTPPPAAASPGTTGTTRVPKVRPASSLGMTTPATSAGASSVGSASSKTKRPMSVVGTSGGAEATRPAHVRATSVQVARPQLDEIAAARAATAPTGQLATRSNLAQVTPSSINMTMHATTGRPPHLSQQTSGAPQSAFTPPSSTLLATSPVPSPLLSPSTLIPNIRPPTPPHGELDTLRGFGTAVIDEYEISSNHSSPVRSAMHLIGQFSPARGPFQHLHQQHPTASCPSSPIPSDTALLSEHHNKSRRAALPWNPHSIPPPQHPAAPDSPELRTVELPTMTPRRSFDSIEGFLGIDRGERTSDADISEWTSQRQSSDSEFSAPVPARVLRDRLSGSTAASDPDHPVHGEHKLEPVLSADAEKARQAKVERKIADLEISNASLMAINRSLEATKAKQRSEIIKLRRMLREGGAFSLPMISAASSSNTTPALGHVPAFPSNNLHRVVSEEEDVDATWGDDEMDDPELEARWDRLAGLVDAMRRIGEDAVHRGNEQVKVGERRVLGWLDVENMAGDQPSSGLSAVNSEVDLASVKRDDDEEEVEDSL